jgi:hypothetical protein
MSGMAVNVTRTPRSDKWISVIAVLMIAAMATLMRSYVAIKLLLLSAFLLVFIFKLGIGGVRIIVYRRLAWFYLCMGMAGAAWSFLGLLHPSNYTQGSLEAFRLYVVWSFAFLVLYTLLRSLPSLQIIHASIVLAGILIPVLNLVGLYDQFSGSSVISDGMRRELEMEIGFGYGYAQYSSANILILFLIVPYLLSLQFRNDSGSFNSKITKLALVLSLTLVVLSGRRALWLVVALTPLTILILSRIAGSSSQLRIAGRRFLLAWTVASILGFGLLVLLPQSSEDVASLSRINEAFSSYDERTIQKPYLLKGFMDSPLVGSGFGASAGYQRSDERPWTYELTYYQMLFNLGLFGMTALGVLFSFYSVKVIQIFRQFKNESAVPFALVVGYCSLFIGAYSNPYFGGFDSLFFVGLLPYLSTFHRGFNEIPSYALPAD